ncbi:heterogeneous nuclear ribonucleoprotein C-like 1 [Lytechinus variegatus]|uniref:heterogeneous nuclear ribonucleoprotein C-like 1 n=1 Tax=Lytechinus variegatus TaxID=7654 RepID=UPI001BB2C6DA|nr:heterogeneous nuclear ribonucleoprotein C-like 1 [Lytechinus variegatus]XP_041454660.1 heterogeneous nuclear ribonucleoprotein C-like 1 [Lytechinus variegatus]XP_041454915.1 heterogeneous nuclear ribonucleoprotein C-like 1 [Lytechinus variegatus]XP_041454917.1 heterogeneous nuclear ribonucleoprotein C-like 1 [Lytechinus variegatus]
MNRPYHGSGGYVGLGYPPPNTFAVSNNTNSNDLASKLSRVFVGNLNPKEVTDRMQLYHIFIKYGNVKAISLHKGYAFVQYDTEAEARFAVAEENGNLFGTQKFDLCVSTERNKSGGGGGGFKRYDSDFDGGYQTAQAKKRRFQDNTLMDKKSGDEPTTWICSYCKHVSVSAWELMKHAAAIHQTQIYDLNGAKPEGE